MGINCAYHESSACLLKDGKLIAFIEEERLSRVKRAKKSLVNNADELPLLAMRYCLSKAGIDFSDVNMFAYNLVPKARLAYCVNVDNGHKLVDDSWGTPEGEKIFYEGNLNVVTKLNELCGRDLEKDFHWIKHHVAHAAGAFYSSGFPSSAIAIIDGIGESKSAWIGMGKDRQLSEYFEVSYPNSLGFIWEKISEYLGFSEYDAEKVMGLAAYGDHQKTISRMRKIINLNGKDGFSVDNEIMLFRTGDFSGLENLFALPKRNKEEELTAAHKDIAAALQLVTEETVLSLARSAQKLSGEKRLCLAGGTALNVVANARVAQSGLFDEIYIQPAANDAGGAVGAAFYLWTNVCGNARVEPVKHAYLGPSYSNDEIKQLLDKTSELEFQYMNDIEKSCAQVLAEGNLVAWLHGAMETGPRALGHRSLLGDPRKADVLELINRKVKRREYFRPLAPSVLAEEAAKWFDLDSVMYDPLHYMLMAVQTKPEKSQLVPAIVHVDGSSRVHIVRKEHSARYWGLIDEFFKLTGVPMLLNTSLNIQEPIVCSPADAIKTYLSSQIDYLVLENYLCKRKAS